MAVVHGPVDGVGSVERPAKGGGGIAHAFVYDADPTPLGTDFRTELWFPVVAIETPDPDTNPAVIRPDAWPFDDRNNLTFVGANLTATFRGTDVRQPRVPLTRDRVYIELGGTIQTGQTVTLVMSFGVGLALAAFANAGDPPATYPIEVAQAFSYESTSVTDGNQPPALVDLFQPTPGGSLLTMTRANALTAPTVRILSIMTAQTTSGVRPLPFAAETKYEYHADGHGEPFALQGQSDEITNFTPNGPAWLLGVIEGARGRQVRIRANGDIYGSLGQATGRWVVLAYGLGGKFAKDVVNITPGRVTDDVITAELVIQPPFDRVVQWANTVTITIPDHPIYERVAIELGADRGRVGSPVFPQFSWQGFPSTCEITEIEVLP